MNGKTFGHIIFDDDLLPALNYDGSIMPIEEGSIRISPRTLKAYINVNGAWQIVGEKVKKTFIVSIEYDSRLQDHMVERYVKTALIKHYSLAKKLSKLQRYDLSSMDSLFDGADTTHIAVSPVKDVDWNDLRSIVAHIKDIEKHFEKLEVE